MKKSEQPTHVFVYGTLREQEQNTHRLDGYALFQINSANFLYPSVRREERAMTFGNLLPIRSKKHLANMDRYENVQGGLFSREIVQVVDLSNNRRVPAYVYVGADFLFPSRIPSGDWFTR